MQISRRRTRHKKNNAPASLFSPRSLFSGAIAALCVVGICAEAARAGAPIAIAKASPDLVQLLQADPNSGINHGEVTAYAAKTLPITGAAVKPKTYHVIVRVSKTRTSLGLSSRYFSHLHMHSINATAQQIVKLLSDPDVKSVSVDRTLSLNQTGGNGVPLDVNPVSVGADDPGAQLAGNPNLDGKGVTVAVVDSGISPVDDIRSHLLAFQDEVNGLEAPYDDYGHGTHVAGIVAGDGTDSSGPTATNEYRGIAPGANIVGVKVLDGTGNATASNVIAGIDWVISNQSTYNIRVINLSITGAVLESSTTDPVCQACEAAVQAGIVVVVSAGNNGGVYGMIGSPANDPYVITVGASNSMQTGTRSDDIITTYTSRGPTCIDGNFKPDLIAPGNKVVSLRVPGSYIDLNNAYCYVPASDYLSGDTSNISTAYTRLSGTSMSAPAVAGAAALLLEENPGLYPSGVKMALMYSAQALTGYDPVLAQTVTYDPLTQGAGELNVPGAVQVASVMSPSGLISAPAMTSTIAGSTVAWYPTTAATTITSSGSTALAWWQNPAVWTNVDLWSQKNLTWGGGGDNLTWGGGGDNLTWGGGGDNLTWGGGGD